MLDLGGASEVRQHFIGQRQGETDKASLRCFRDPDARTPTGKPGGWAESGQEGPRSWGRDEIQGGSGLDSQAAGLQQEQAGATPWSAGGGEGAADGAPTGYRGAAYT